MFNYFESVNLTPESVELYNSEKVLKSTLWELI